MIGYPDTDNPRPVPFAGAGIVSYDEAQAQAPESPRGGALVVGGVVLAIALLALSHSRKV